jgi:ABC-2 type transport system ATP-binding protein
VLSLETIRKRYGRREVLRGLDLQVGSSEIYGLLGANGAGKSTALKILCGLVHPDSGRVRIDGFDLANQRGEALRRIGAQIEQPAFAGHLSGRRTLRGLTRLAELEDEEAERKLAEVGLADRADDAIAKDSSGMRQRLGIAAALLGNPPLLVIDEPTTGLDPDGRQELLRLIAELRGRHGCSVLFTSHLFDEIASLCDRCGILHEGALRYDGPPGSARELRERYFDLGAGEST